MGDTQPKVDNPMRQALVTLRNSLRAEVEILKDVFRTTDSDMQSKEVWTTPAGGAADKWKAEIHGKRRRMLTLVGKLIPAVEAEIAKCPRKVSQAEAKMMRMDLEMR